MVSYPDSRPIHVKPTTGPAATGDTSATLARIHDPDVHLAIWHRPLPPALATIAAQDRRSIDSIDLELEVAALDASLPPLLADAGHPPTAAPPLAALARNLAAVMACTHVRLRLEVIETDACHRFHADYVTARLLMTIAGPGTEWRLADAGDDAAIERLLPGDVALFKGRLWAETPAILHRSPPIAGTGTDRLLLVIDPLTREAVFR